MAKTRSQGLSSAVKNEEHEEKTRLEQQLHSTNNASKNRNKVTKNRKPIQAQITKVKSENVDDNKALLVPPKKKAFKKSNITAEQIAKLISYIVKDKMSVLAAARKAGISQGAAYRYYHEYKDDSEHKIPLPNSRLNNPLSTISQEKIDSLIHCIVHDGMNKTQAAKKVGISRKTAAKYYAKYLEDPEQKIPLLDNRTGKSSKRHTQEAIADFIGYIVRDKLSVAEASKKVNMSRQSARRYYLMYLYDPNHKIPNPYDTNYRKVTPYTNDQVSSLIKYVENDGLSVVEASVKANISISSASKYYKQYLDDPENKIPTPKTNTIRKTSNPLTPDQVKNFFCYIIVDELNVTQASLKADISQSTGSYYYEKYMENRIQEANIRDMTYSPEKMKRLVKLVQDKNMSVPAAADIVHLNRKSATKYYDQYLENPQYEFPPNKDKQYTQEDMKRLIDYIENDKMTVYSAAKKMKMNQTTARRYYKEYRNDPEHKIPVQTIRGHIKTNKTLDKYAQIIADIYKDNPSIKPVHGNHDVLMTETKEELEEKDTKIALKMENN